MAPTEQDTHNKFRQEKNYALEKSASTKNMLLHRPSPEYLVRTGSMKNKVIKDSSASACASSTLPLEKTKSGEATRKGRGNYAFYNIQAGCFTWQGRAFYKNSYMMQRNEGKVRKSFLNNYGEGKNLVANDNVPSRKLSKQNILQSNTSVNSSTQQTSKNNILTQSLETKTGGQQCKSDTRKGQNEERGRCQESKAPRLLNDDIKIQTAKVKKLEYKRGDPNISNTVCEKKMEKIIPSKKLDKHPRDERQNVTKEKGKILSDEKQTKRQSDDSRRGRDDLRLYENWSPRIPSLENICQKFDGQLHLGNLSESETDPQPGRPHYDSDLDTDLLQKMKEKLKLLTDHQFSIDYKIVLNNVKGTDIEKKFRVHASASEIEKFKLYVDEFDSVNSLIRGLAGRLASAEDSLGRLAEARGDSLDNRWIMLTRKREKLEAQLAEAIWIKNAIEKKTPKIESSLLRHAGEAELLKFRAFLAEKEQLISASAELGDKVRLCHKQIIEMELGHSVYP